MFSSVRSTSLVILRRPTTPAALRSEKVMRSGPRLSRSLAAVLRGGGRAARRSGVGAVGCRGPPAGAPPRPRAGAVTGAAGAAGADAVAGVALLASCAAGLVLAPHRATCWAAFFSSKASCSASSASFSLWSCSGSVCA